MSLVDAVGPRAERLLEPALPLASDLGRFVAVVDVEAVGEHVVEQGVREARAGVGGPAAEPPHLLGDLVEPAIELGEQARLAHAGVADDR